MDAESLELETATRIGRDDGGSSTAVSSGTSLSGQPGEIGSGAGVAGPAGIHKGARNRGRSLTSMTNPYSPSSPAPLPSPSLRPATQGRRSRAPTITFPPPLPPVLSRENSPDEYQIASGSASHLAPGPDYFDRNDMSSYSTPPRLVVQSSNGPMDSPTELNFSPSTRYYGSSLPSPTIVLPPTVTGTGKGKRPASRSISHHPRAVRTPSLSATANTGAGSSNLSTPPPHSRNGLTRRTSTPSLRALVSSTLPEALPEVPDDRAMNISQASLGTGPAQADQSRARATSTSIVRPNIPSIDLHGAQPTTLATPYPPYQTPYTYPELPVEASTSTASAGLDLLTAAYNLGESSVRTLGSWISSTGGHVRRNSRKGKGRATAEDDDSEKGLGSGDDGEGDAGFTADSGSPSTGGRGSLDWTGPSIMTEGYFGLPRSPPPELEQADFVTALRSKYGQRSSLPTPAISSASLSANAMGSSWDIATKVIGARSTNERGDLKVMEVARELGWTLAALGLCFVVTASIVFAAIKSMPITTLRQIPKSVGDLQLLSAEIKTYMESSSSGWWHTVGVLMLAGCWKHAWSVPGAVVLNILVGSLISPLPALVLLTLITSFGSLGAYTLSRPLAPLIGLLFPKPLALVSAALAPSAEAEIANEKVSVWRRLLVMRAMGFVPWSGMNVACGVVGVRWTTFVLTTAGGSASWSYVTASVGQILARLAVPTSTLNGSLAEDAITSSNVVGGESLTSLLRDPALIAKLIILSMISLLPALLKRRAKESEKPEAAHHHLRHLHHDDEPLSPLSTSLASFTPTPHAFDLMSFARTGARQGAVVVMGAVRGIRRALHVTVGSENR